MRPIAADVVYSMVCLPACLLDTRVSSAKTAEPIEMPFGELTYVGLRSHVLGGAQGRMNPFAAARDDTTAMWAFVRIL